MYADEFQERVKKRASKDYHYPMTGQQEDIIHAAMGLASEGGELLDHIKAFVFYGKEFDYAAMDKEAGDIAWFLGHYLNARGKTFEQLFDENDAKLEARYPLGTFNEAHALHRDLDAEDRAVENLNKG